MQEPEPPVIQPFVFTFSWRRFLVHCLIMGICIFLGLMTWYFGKPPNMRFYETKTEEQLSTTIAPDIHIALDSRSSVAVKDGQPLQVEIFKGRIYFDIRKNAVDRLEVKVGDVLIRNLGTRFSIEMRNDGIHHVAVADGHIKIHLSAGTYQINALEEADFDNKGISKHQLIGTRDIAPWRAQ